MHVSFKKYCHHNTILRSKEEVSRGSILFIFYVLKYGEKRGRVSHSPSMAVWTTSKAVWQTCILALCISHWMDASLLRIGRDEMRVRNELVWYHDAWMNNNSSQITSGFSSLFLWWFANSEALFKKPWILQVHDWRGQSNIRFNDKKFWLELFFL